MLTSNYALENIAKAHIQDEIDRAARGHMASQARTRKPAERSPRTGTIFGFTALILAAVKMASAF